MRGTTTVLSMRHYARTRCAPHRRPDKGKTENAFIRTTHPPWMSGNTQPTTVSTAALLPEQLAKKTRRRACNLSDRDEGSSVADVHTKTDSARKKTVASDRSHQQQLQDPWPLVCSKSLRHSVATHVVRGASDDRYVAVTDDVGQRGQVDLVRPRQVPQGS